MRREIFSKFPQTECFRFAIDFYFVFSSRHLPIELGELNSAASTCISQNFTELANREEIIEFDIDDFYSIINDEMLNVRDESHAWKCCIRWVDHDPEKRKQHIVKLMSGIRLGLLDPRVMFLIMF